MEAFSEYLRDTGDPWILTERGRTHLALGHYDEAINDFTTSLGYGTAPDPFFHFFRANHSEALQGRAAAYEKLGNPLKANEDHASATTGAPNTASELRARAIIRLARNDLTGALSDAEHAAKLDSFNWHWVHNLARAMTPPVLARSAIPLEQLGSSTQATIAYLDEPPAEIQPASKMNLNGVEVEVTEIDRTAKTITLSGRPDALRESGLNFLSSVSNTWTFWYENYKI